MTLRLLILSDMHVVSSSEDQVSRMSLETPEIPEEFNAVEALKIFLDNYDFNINYLINLGDVSNKSNPACWFFGIKLLRDIQNAKQIAQVVHVVGNHDVTCVKPPPDGDPFYLPKHTKKFPVESSQISNEFWSKGYCIYELDHLLLLIVNTETHLTNEEKLSVSPSISLNKIQEIDKELQQHIGFEGAKIALMHHHIIMHSDQYGNLTSNDVVDNGDMLLDVLDNHGFKMVIHGHKHLARITNYKDVVVFASGSFSSRENLQMTNADNLFHIVNLDIDSGNVNGFIETYHYIYNKGWDMVTDPEAHFAHHIGLGINKNMDDLAKKIVAKYHDRLEQHAQIKPQEYLTDFCQINYLSVKQYGELKNLLRKHSYEFIPGKNVLLKLVE